MKFKIKNILNKKQDAPSRRSVSQAKPYVVNKTISRTLRKINQALASPGDENNVSPRVKTHRLTVHRRRVFAILIVSLLICSFAIWLLVQLTSEVRVVITPGTQAGKVDVSNYKKAIESYMSAYPMARLRPLFSQTQAMTFLSEDYPEIESILDMGKDSSSQTTYKITFRQPVAGWKVGQVNYYVDSKGRAFEKNNFKEPTLKIIDDSGIKTNDVALVASNRLLNFVSQVVVNASQSGYEVTEAIIPADTTRQLDIRLKGVGGIVKLSLDRSATEQIEDMHNALNFFKQKATSFNYLDVRVSGKAFYK